MVRVMDMEELAKRKSPRLQSFDYNSTGAYFITMCTKNRRCMLSRIVETGVLDCPSVELTPYGKIADKFINQLNDFYENISVDRYIIMPNHIHLLLFVRGDGQSSPSTESKEYAFVPTGIGANTTVSRFVSTFKRFCNKEYGENIWQDRFNDHIIRNREDYEEHIKCIYENPVNWYYDKLYSDN